MKMTPQERRIRKAIAQAIHARAKEDMTNARLLGHKGSYVGAYARLQRATEAELIADAIESGWPALKKPRKRS